jgi:hypothetical protein
MQDRYVLLVAALICAVGFWLNRRLSSKAKRHEDPE